MITNDCTDCIRHKPIPEFEHIILKMILNFLLISSVIAYSFTTIPVAGLCGELNCSVTSVGKCWGQIQENMRRQILWDWINSQKRQC